MFRNNRSTHSSGRFNYSRRPQNPRRGGGGFSQHIDANRYIRKAVVQDQEAYVAKNRFSDFAICEELKKNIAEKNYLTPTPIQDQVIPLLLEGKDVVGIANTGTGKTAAFLIPLINKVFLNRQTRVLIVTPTRELALQIQQECRDFSKMMGMSSVLVIGGTSMHNQIYALQRNPNFVVGTPGRLKDLMEQRKLNISQFNSIVLDEVDRMMDMGFINDIKFFISALPAIRQSMFFSATIAPQLTGIMNSFLRNPARISVKVSDTVGTVEQDVVRICGRKKLDVLHELISQEGFEKVLVFGKTKHGVEQISTTLIQRGHKAAAIHGNKSQSQRQRALDLFKRGDVRILLATDVAARGLDICDVTHVINFDQPATYDDYVHRIGRTGRANKKGMALTFVD